jgi:hypothetical protein
VVDLARQALAVGVDVALACSGEIAENRALLAGVPALSDVAQRRLRAARAQVAPI